MAVSFSELYFLKSTVTECIEQIADKISSSRILVAAPSNSAANIIIDRLLASGKFKDDFVRIVAFNQVEKDLIPDHLKKHCVTVKRLLENYKRDRYIN